MKSLIFCAAMLLAYTMHAQVIPGAEEGNFNKIDGEVAYQEVIEVGDTPTDELYKRARLWFATQYKNSDEVLEISDAELGILQGTGFGEENPGIQVWITTRIEVKPNRYRYTINNLRIKVPASQYIPEGLDYPLEEYYQRKKNKKIRARILQHLQSHLDDLKAAMRADTGSDDW